MRVNDLSHADHVPEPQVVVDEISILVVVADKLLVNALFPDWFLNDDLVAVATLELCEHRLVGAVPAIRHAVLLPYLHGAVPALKSHNPRSEKSVVAESSLILCKLRQLILG